MATGYVNSMAWTSACKKFPVWAGVFLFSIYTAIDKRFYFFKKNLLWLIMRSANEALLMINHNRFFLKKQNLLLALLMSIHNILYFF